jgi:predicted dehydrogenase
MSKLRWGVLSTSKFALTKILPAMQHCRYSEAVAVASRDLAKAQAFAAQFNLPKAYGSYEALLADPDIDVIYNPTPNHLHVPLTIKALEAGKHVLCEKPIGLNSSEAQLLVEAATQHPSLKVMEAFMFRLHPQWIKAKEIVKAGGIGELRTVQSLFSYFNNDAANVRNQADIGGGGLMDIGCYNISLSRFLFDAEPKRVMGLVEYDPQFHTDRIASGMLDFGNGAATFTCSTQLAPYQRVHIFGTTGRIEIEIPFNAPPDQPTRLWHQHDGQTDEISFAVCDQYTIEADAFSLAVINGTPVATPLTDAVANMRVIEAVVISGKTNSWVTL